MKRITVTLIAALLLLPLAAQAGGGKNRNRNQERNCSLSSILEQLPEQNLRTKEVEDLLFMREEEKLARDVYLSLYEEWDLRIFRQIAKAERTHMQLALALIDKYELEDPVGDNGLGVFANAELQSLYEGLTSTGVISPESALLVGAAIEDVDIYDLQQAYERTNNEDLQVLYQNLIKGSRNHLRGFAGQLERLGVTYEPEYISLEEYNEIISSPKEKGIVDANGELLCGGGKRR